MRALLALPLLLAACDPTVKRVEAPKLAASVVCAAVDDRYDRCKDPGLAKDPFPDGDIPTCEQQVGSGGMRKYWECVAQLDCSNNPGSCESLKP